LRLNDRADALASAAVAELVDCCVGVRRGCAVADDRYACAEGGAGE
jgi:hypothetical protein